ncbi:MAG: hypothetical protein A3D57_00140 [Candidatus Sungbacteria bacterium RIFCSPHIGHO2_02_FULL_46_12]|nr:MAG: hypothetical protein A3D57_00140 [Candidatus Sungbacteria bacterium RIFCSPHIGHO2_02_FULL_46_12]
MSKTNIYAGVILCIMFVLLISSAWNDSAIMDELAHIPAGYSYIAKQDYRLNPEHPPLFKDLSGLFIFIFAHPNFPTNTDAWNRYLNGQWDQGSAFLYGAGNNPDRIVFWGRLPIMLLAMLFGGLLYWYIKKRYSSKIALLTLFFFAFSPTFLAHSRFVTTDLAAAFGFFIGIIGLVTLLEKPTLKHIFLAGLLLGIAQLLKFSLVLLFPIYGIITLVWIWVERPYWKGVIRFPFFALQMLGKLAVVFAVAFVAIIAVYSYHVIHYPAVSIKPGGVPWTKEELTRIVKLPEPERTQKMTDVPLSQMRDTVYILSSFAGGPDPEDITCDPKSGVSLGRHLRCLTEFTIWATDKPMLRPLAQYLLGVQMVVQRASGGNTTYVLGEVSAGGWIYYFPVLYALKETLAFHILTLTALLFAFWRILKGEKSFGAFRRWIHENIFEFISIFFILFYWAYSIKSPLNIGVRHVLPTFPFIYFLVSREIHRWLSYMEQAAPETWWEWLVLLYKRYIASIPKYIFIWTMLFWIFASAIYTFPAYLSYFNELTGGSSNGYMYAVDSNYDWGQDLIRLQKYVRDHRVQHIALDYFGGGSPGYYLKDRVEGWGSAKGQPHGYFAISATFLEGAYGKPVAGFIRNPQDEYEWLKPFRPIDRAGESILIYKLP